MNKAKAYITSDGMMDHRTPYPSVGTKDVDKPLETSPHYTDRRFDKEQTVFCSEPERLVSDGFTVTIPGCHYDYSDRLREWDYKREKNAVLVANDTGAKRKTARWYQVYLSHYYGRQVELKHIVAGVNRGNGYPYCVYGTKAVE